MLYYVPKEELVKRHRIDLDRRPSAEGSTDGVFLWGQAMYFISQLLGSLNESNFRWHVLKI